MPAPPLAALRVLELARVLAGPWAGQLLADLGADVLKIEHPRGDDTRQWGPPFVDHPDGSRDAAYFHACNRGKRSVAVDFSTPEGRATVLRLADDADVLIENFKVGGLAKHGLDYATLQARNPRLVYCSITGFGQTGPRAGQAGYDFVIQGMSGLMELTGDPSGPPQKIGVAFADVFTGVYAVVGIQAALAQRERTGRGQWVDLALLDTMVGVLANQGLNQLVAGGSPTRLGNAHPNLVPYEAFPTADRWIIVAVGNDDQFRRLCGVLGHLRWAEDERFSTNEARVRHRGVLVGQIRAALASWPADELQEALDAVGVPAGPIHRVEEALSDPQVQARGMVRELVRRSDGVRVPSIVSPIRFSDAELAVDEPSPRLDQDAPSWR